MKIFVLSFVRVKKIRFGKVGLGWGEGMFNIGIKLFSMVLDNLS